jgi:DNA modification methylase
MQEASIDLIITSPPYASNAIDYMRAHKFSLIWLGYPIVLLSRKRKEYIGGEKITEIRYEKLPEQTHAVVAKISKLDSKKGMVLHRYYSEMKRTLFEMFRVLKPGKSAILVVGSSTMRGQDTKIHLCLSEIGQSIGFKIPKIGVRSLDRNKRMLPAGSTIDLDSQIQQRMHEEYVIGFYKP